jgi:hypothetical protein
MNNQRFSIENLQDNLQVVFLRAGFIVIRDLILGVVNNLNISQLSRLQEATLGFNLEYLILEYGFLESFFSRGLSWVCPRLHFDLRVRG